MGTVTQNLFKLFRQSGSGSGQEKNPRDTGVRSRRHSSGFKEFMRTVGGREELSFLDLGATSATNISLLTERGSKIYTEDLLGASADADLLKAGEDGAKTIDVDRFLKEN